MQTKRYFLFREGDGNEGNFPREMIALTPEQCPYAALRALCINRRIVGTRTRRHIAKHIEIDGEAEYGVTATVYEGPDGEQAFGAAWLTAELEPYTEEEYVNSPYCFAHTLRDALDLGAWRDYLKQTRKVCKAPQTSL